MGCFNTVITNCKNCLHVIEFQSNAGTCNLEIFNIDEIPINEALNLNSHTEVCSNCQCENTLKLASYIPKTVRMIIK